MEKTKQSKRDANRMLGQPTQEHHKMKNEGSQPQLLIAAVLGL